ncbi:unnamed protein product [Angiostrongylus costaricensis]|uniref:Uncharacterized protein n=1 Tax=Angiostrongylus costaricensis TaxID=334426 RepID=A0A0R3PCG7_ANGCS|nr:unnamed protein product [Angiostrongylus costaricensis]
MMDSVDRSPSNLIGIAGDHVTRSCHNCSTFPGCNALRPKAPPPPFIRSTFFQETVPFLTFDFPIGESSPPIMHASRIVGKESDATAEQQFPPLSVYLVDMIGTEAE